jgi:hypothetical protein
MPNWVYNGLTVEGNPESVKKMMDQLNKPFTMTHDSWDVSTNTFMKKNTLYPNPVFAFHNIYNHTQAGISDEEYLKQPDHSLPLEEALKFEGNHWYDFNVREWGTKWDVAVSSEDKSPNTYMEDTANGDNYVVYYNFETAWSRPMTALIKLSNQYPDLLFTLSYEEETGWGGELEILRGEIISESEYQNMCRECDETDCLEYDEESGNEVCTKCDFGREEQ